MNTSTKNRGFTLIEIIVSLAIFTIVAVVAVGSLVRIVALNRQAQTLQSSVNNISFALDSVSREIRQGSKITCQQGFVYGNTFTSLSGLNGLSCTGLTGNQLIAFQSSKTDPNNPACSLIYAYLFTASDPQYSLPNMPPRLMLEKAQQNACSDALGSSAAPFVPLVSPDVTLTDYRLGMFYDPASMKYKSVFVRLIGYSGARVQDQNEFDVETSISQRIHD